MNPSAGSGTDIKEFTVRAFILGLALAVVMAAANTYLGLYAGMTVSASIPAAVISMSIMRGILKKGSILENNIVQTMASAGESIAGGIIFTVPALVIIGVWQDFRFWPTTLIALCGGLLGVVFMIPMRRALIVEDRELTYPEGVACAEVLKAGERGGPGFRAILGGLAAGGAVKLFTTVIQLLKGTVESAFFLGQRLFFIGCDISPAMVGVGYIINLDIALMVFLGSAFAWVAGVPLMGIPADMAGAPPLEVAWHLWRTQIRYVGVGAMVVGGIWSIISVRRGIARGLTGLRRSGLGVTPPPGPEGEGPGRTGRDMGLAPMTVILVLCLGVLTFLYEMLTAQWGLSIITALFMAVAAFFFVAVSSYIVGLVGSTNNPISGMTISALLGVSALFLVLGWKGDSAILATLGVAGVVCCAASSAGDMSQDLKTGSLVGSTPARQQAAQMAGVAVAAFFIAPVLSLLHSAYGIGTGLKAPQATLFASITRGVFGGGEIPRAMILTGAVIGIVLIGADRLLEKRGAPFRVHVMPVAVGIYLPLSLIVPMVAGGIIRYLADKRTGAHGVGETGERGVLLSSGMIAGEALMGIIAAAFIVMDLKVDPAIPAQLQAIISLAVMAAVVVFLYRKAARQQR
ncbi:MAG: oligopeptide transporter, OPT family [Spirochaetes bacterium]|nr:oligopeptide transporter, OPT family [Spirochaetota bacterium]